MWTPKFGNVIARECSDTGFYFIFLIDTWVYLLKISNEFESQWP